MAWNAFFRSNIEPVMAYQPGLRTEQIREIAVTDEVHKLSSNESPLPPFPSALAAMAEKLVALNEYPDGSSHDLTQLLAWHYDRTPEQIIIGNGSNELLDLIAETCLQPGDNVVYGWPSFVVYQSSAMIADAEFRQVPLSSDGSYDLKALLAAIDERTKIAFICTPNNPTGGVVSQDALKRFLDAVPPHVLVIMDVAYEEFIDEAQAPDAAKPLAFFDGKRPYVVLKTFSKMYALAGIRCGFGFAPAILVEMVNKVREPFNVNTVAQVGAIASLEDAEEIARRRALNTEGRSRLQACFAELGLRSYPSQANFVWVEVPDAATSFEALLKRGLIVRPFAGANGLRITVGDEAAVTAVIAAFEELFDWRQEEARVESWRG
ncbi:MAG: histidinol-phosphate transaminase [Coriobacteriales bacterium]|jgi:histidinol-phosphate aminotransferase|nr:histidinol-phosphate transaminase [Coriobacteriales bacterium]